ncbi:MAG TPA: pilus assembly protein [Gammaproteobacteria bacterium]|nr:pilus assembly protein [Gammaproteobacteria bacterium]
MQKGIAAKGFVFKELFIVLLVVMALLAIAYPAYRDYLQRNYYKQILEAVIPFKTAVAKCFKKHAAFTGCNAGSFAIPETIKLPKGAVANLSVMNGVITATPVAYDGILATDTYILTPKIVNDELTWMPSGNAILRGFAE